VFDGLGGERFDLIVSNPPYVPLAKMDGLQTEVRDFEPHIALTDGADGLTLIDRIIKRCPHFLHPKGAILTEIGFDQSQPVASMFDTRTWRAPVIFPDLQGIPRLVFSELN
jgi:release factor glutamine methyltransferase